MELFIGLGLPIILLIGLTLFFMSDGIPSWVHVFNRDSSTLSDILCDEQSIPNFDKFQWDEVKKCLRDHAKLAMNNDQELLRRNVVEEQSLQSIATEIGISRERVRQKVDRAKRYLAAVLIEHRDLVA